jgi:hypothetical protein
MRKSDITGKKRRKPVEEQRWKQSQGWGGQWGRCPQDTAQVTGGSNKSSFPGMVGVKVRNCGLVTCKWGSGSCFFKALWLNNGEGNDKLCIVTRGGQSCTTNPTS